MVLCPPSVPLPQAGLQTGGPARKKGREGLHPDPVLLRFPLQYDEHVISPKEFVHLAGKSTLKDWKRAIRMNGIMLRWVRRASHTASSARDCHAPLLAEAQ